MIVPDSSLMGKARMQHCYHAFISITYIPKKQLTLFVNLSRGCKELYMEKQKGNKTLKICEVILMTTLKKKHLLFPTPTIWMWMYINLVSGDGQLAHDQTSNVNMGTATTNHTEENQSSVAYNKPESPPHQTSSSVTSAECSATETTSTTSRPSYSSEPFLDAGVRKDHQSVLCQQYSAWLLHLPFYTVK